MAVTASVSPSAACTHFYDSPVCVLGLDLTVMAKELAELYQHTMTIELLIYINSVEPLAAN